MAKINKGDGQNKLLPLAEKQTAQDTANSWKDSLSPQEKVTEQPKKQWTAKL